MPRPPRETETDRAEIGDRAANSRQAENQPWTRNSKIARDARAATKQADTKKGKG